MYVNIYYNYGKNFNYGFSFSMDTMNNIGVVSFKSSRMNILSTADNHGDILRMPQLMKAIQMNKKDLFERAAEKSTFNILSIAGDFFMNPKKRGLFTNPTFCMGDVQYNFLTKLIYIAKMAAGKHSNFDTNYTPGNHCLDGGDEWLFSKLMRAPMTTLLTNVNRSKSPLPSKLMYENPNITQVKVYEIPDSKDSSKVNKVLFLGVTIPSMNYFNPGLLKKTVFYNNSNKNDVLLEEKDLRKTIRVIKYYVNSFKKLNPSGGVVLLAHTGNKIASMFANNIPNINLIINGHDHKEFETLVGSTLILSHGQASKFFRDTQLCFDDKGKLTIRSRKYETDRYEPIARKDKILQNFVNVNIGKDLIPLVKYTNSEASPEEMVLSDSIKYSNSVLANYLTDAVKSAALKTFPDLDLVGLPSTIVRNGLKSNERRSTLNNMDFLKIFDGVNANLERLKIGRISGEELYSLILENVLNNLKSKTRNALIQWSDIQINRSAIKEMKDSQVSDFRDFIKIKNKQTNKYERIDFNREYRILLSDKYLSKNTENIKIPAKIRGNFEKTNFTYEDLFMDYLESINFDVKMTANAREERVI